VATIVGSTAERDGNQEWFGASSTNHFAENFTMPERGKITRVGVWAAGKDADVSARVCVWNAAGAVVAQSAQFTMAARPFGIGQNDLYERPLATPYVADAGEVVHVGFARNPAGTIQLGYDSGGVHRHDYSSTWPASIATYTEHGGTLGVYFEYEPAHEVYVRRGGVWVLAERIYVRRGGAWVEADSVQVRRGSAWVDA
jgi:hypothetical protein